MATFVPLVLLAVSSCFAQSIDGAFHGDGIVLTARGADDDISGRSSDDAHAQGRLQRQYKSATSEWTRTK